MNGVESWEATTDVGKKPGAAQPRASSRGGERSSANENYEPRTQQAQSPRGEQRANNTQKQTAGQRTQNSQSAQRQAGSGSRARANYETRRAQPIKAGSRPQKPDREDGVSISLFSCLKERSAFPSALDRRESMSALSLAEK